GTTSIRSQVLSQYFSLPQVAAVVVARVADYCIHIQQKDDIKYKLYIIKNCKAGVNLYFIQSVCGWCPWLSLQHVGSPANESGK
ncbi:hypothetical protein AGOR_G00075710, partial [Albula goreensis]